MRGALRRAWGRPSRHHSSLSAWLSSVPPRHRHLRAGRADVRAIRFRDDLTVREIAAPQGLAPDALAIAGDVRPGPTAPTPPTAPAASSCCTIPTNRPLGRPVAHRLLRAGAARDRDRHRSPARRRGLVLAHRCAGLAQRGVPLGIRHRDEDPVEGLRGAGGGGRRGADRTAGVVVAGRPDRPARGSMGGAGLHARRSSARLGRGRRCSGTHRVAAWLTTSSSTIAERPRRLPRRLAAGDGPVAVDVERASGLPLLAARLSGAGVPPRRRRVPLRPAADRRLPRAPGRDRRRGMGAPRRQPGPAFAAGAGPRAARPSSTPSWPRACWAMSASASAPSSRTRSGSPWPRRTPHRTGRPGRSPSRGWSTRRSTSSTSSTCGTRSWTSSTSRARPSIAAEEFRARARARAQAAARGALAPAERPAHGARAARRSRSRASCGWRARTSRGKRTSPPAGWCPIGRSSPPCSPTRSRSRTSPR